jgi:hypothetical protein
MTNVDPWEKAADCERSLEVATDPQKRSILTKLRDLWITLGNDCSLVSEAELAKNAESINRMHIELMAR